MTTTEGALDLTIFFWGAGLAIPHCSRLTGVPLAGVHPLPRDTHGLASVAEVCARRSQLTKGEGEDDSYGRKEVTGRLPAVVLMRQSG